MASNWLKDERGQDLIEYSLLVGFIALAGAAAMMNMGNTIGTIWTIINGRFAGH